MTDADDTLILFHVPQSRSAGVLALLEELGAPFRLHVLNMKAGEQRQPAYLAVNPLGKVPAVLHRGALVTEQVALFIYLADLFPSAGLAPAIDDMRRGAYLRWLVFYAACYEPGLVDTALKREPGPLAMSPYGDFGVVLNTVVHAITVHPYLLGETISAADILWGHALGWGTAFGLVPASPPVTAYIARILQRPAALKVAADDTERAAMQAAPTQ